MKPPELPVKSFTQAVKEVNVSLSRLSDTGEKEAAKTGKKALGVIVKHHRRLTYYADVNRKEVF